MPALLLASASPRRRELLALGGVEFTVSPGSAPETPHPGEAPAALARRLSHEKALAGGADGAVVLGADTIVVLDDDIIGKPRDAAHAGELLRRLRGRAHRVLTGITVLDPAGGAATDLVESLVPMRAYSDAEIDAYVATGDPLDKAGAYAIQHPAFQPVDLPRFTGCVANVMGLPVCAALRLLAAHGIASTLAHPPGHCQAYDRAACPLAPRLFVNVPDPAILETTGRGRSSG